MLQAGIACHVWDLWDPMRCLDFPGSDFVAQEWDFCNQPVFLICPEVSLWTPSRRCVSSLEKDCLL